MYYQMCLDMTELREVELCIAVEFFAFALKRFILLASPLFTRNHRRWSLH